MFATATKSKPKAAATNVAPSVGLDDAIRERLHERAAERSNVLLAAARRVADGETIDADALADELQAVGATPEDLEKAVALQRERREWAATLASTPNVEAEWASLRERRQAAEREYQESLKKFEDVRNAIQQAEGALEAALGRAMTARQRLVSSCPDALLLSRERALASRRLAISKQAESARQQLECGSEVFVNDSGHPISRETLFRKLQVLKSRRSQLDRPGMQDEMKAVDLQINEVEDKMRALDSQRAKLLKQLAEIDRERELIVAAKLIP